MQFKAGILHIFDPIVEGHQFCFEGLVAPLPKVFISCHFLLAAWAHELHLGGQSVVQVVMQALIAETVSAVEFFDVAAGPLVLADEAGFGAGVTVDIRFAPGLDVGPHGDGDVDGLVFGGFFFFLEEESSSGIAARAH